MIFLVMLNPACHVPAACQAAWIQLAPKVCTSMIHIQQLARLRALHGHAAANTNCAKSTCSSVS